MLTVGFNGKQYWFERAEGIARHTYHALGKHADQAQKFRYAISQELASSQEAQRMINKVGGPLATEEVA